MLVEDEDSELVPGVEAVVVFVVLLVLELECVPPPAGEGFTIVVLFSVFFSAAGVTVSVFCSQAAKSAALAKMQIYFFISMDGLPDVGLMPESERLRHPALPSD